MHNLFRTTLDFVVKDNATAALESVTAATGRAGKQAQSTSASFKNLAGAFTALVVAQHVKNALIAVIDPARKMEQAMMRLAFTMGRGGPMDKSVQALRANAERVAEFTVFGPQEAMNATVLLTRALRDTNSTMKATRIAAGLAQASFGKMKLETSAQMVAQMAKAFGMSADQIAVAGDKIFAVSRYTGTGVEHFAGIMGRLAMAGKLGNETFEGMLKAFSMINRLVPDAKSASNLLVSMMAKLSNSKAQAALGSVVNVTDAQMRIRPLAEILLDLAKKAETSSVDVRMSLTKAFGARQIKPMLALLTALQRGIKGINGETLSGAQLMGKLDQVMAHAGGSLQKGINASMQTADAQMRRAGEAWTKFKTVLGEQLLPMLQPLASAFADLLGFIVKVGKALGDIPGLASLAKAAIAVTGLMLAMKALSLASTAVSAIITSVQSHLISTSTATVQATAATRAYEFSRTMAARADFAALTGQRLTALGYRTVGAAARFASQSMSLLRTVGLFLAIEGAMKLYSWLKKLKASWEGIAKNSLKSPGGLFETLTDALKKGQTFKAWWILDSAKHVALMKSFNALLNSDAQKRAIMLKASAKQASMLLQLGSKPFQDTINKLEGLVKSKPKEFKVSDVVAAQSWLKKVQATPAGREIVTPSGKRMEVTPAMISSARNALALSQGAMRTLYAAVRTKQGMTTEVTTQVAAAMKALNLAVKGSVDTESKSLIKSGENPALAMLHQLKGPQIAARTARAQLSGISPTTAPNYVLGAFAQKTQAQYLASMRGRKGEVTGNAPAPGAFLTDERRQLTAMTAFDRAEKAAKENQKALNSIDEHIKRLTATAEMLQKFGVKSEPTGDPGRYHSGLFDANKM